MRREERGICWIWYYADSEEEATKWYVGLIGHEPYPNAIFEWKGEWAFRLHM